METFRPWPATVIRSYYEHPPDRGQGIRALRAGASRNELSLSRGRSSHSCRCQRMCQDRLRAGGRGRVYRSSQFCFDIPVAPAPAASIRTCSCWVRSSGAWASTSGEDRQRSVLHLKDVYFISSGTVSEYDVEVRDGIEHPHRRFPWPAMGFSSEQKYSDEFHLTREGLEAWSPHVCEFVIGFAEHVGCESALIEADSTLAAHD